MLGHRCRMLPLRRGMLLHGVRMFLPRSHIRIECCPQLRPGRRALLRGAGTLLRRRYPLFQGLRVIVFGGRPITLGRLGGLHRFRVLSYRVIGFGPRPSGTLLARVRRRSRLRAPGSGASGTRTPVRGVRAPTRIEAGAAVVATGLRAGPPGAALRFPADRGFPAHFLHRRRRSAGFFALR